MAFSVQLDTLAAATVLSLLSDRLLKKWLETGPSEDELKEFAAEMVSEAKNAHSVETLPAEVELLIVEAMLKHLQTFLGDRLPTGIL